MSYCKMILVTLLGLGFASQPTHADSGAQKVEGVVLEFMRAFSHCDWEPFLQTMSEDCVMFFPFASHPLRANSREEVAATLKPIFERLRSRKAVPPYLELHPVDMEIRMLGKAAGIATWHFKANGIGRRTAVVEKLSDGWRIVSFHASRMQAE